MAVEQTGSQFLSNTNEPSNSSDFTVTAWCLCDSDSTGFFGIDDLSNEWGFGINASLQFFISQNYSSAAAESTSRSSGVWYFVGLVRSGTNSYLYVGTESVAISGVAASASTGSTPWPNTGDAQIFWFVRRGDGYSDVDKSIAYARCWTAALSQAEVEAERLKMSAVRTANLYAEWDFASNATKTVDSGPNGYTLTVSAETTWADATGPTGLTEPGGSIVPHAMAGYRMRTA